MAIAVVTHAILTKEEVLLELDVDESQHTKTDLAHLLINRITAALESWLDRVIVSRGTDLTEFHTMGRLRRPVSELYTLEWPIISVTSVHEDEARAYGADKLLVENTDYIVNKPEGKLIRVAGSDQPSTTWGMSFREYQVLYQGGYSAVADVPDDLQGVAAELVVGKFREITKHHHNLSGVVDDVGNLTRFGAAALSKDQRIVLNAHKRREPPSSRTGERDT